MPTQTVIINDKHAGLLACEVPREFGLHFIEIPPHIMARRARSMSAKARKIVRGRFHSYLHDWPGARLKFSPKRDQFAADFTYEQQMNARARL